MATKNKPVIPAPGSLTHPFRLGDMVKDKLNGLEGRAVSRQFHMTGCDRFTIEPAPKDGKPGEFYSVAAERLDLLESCPDFHREEVPDIHVRLGDKVKAIHMGVEGIATVINVPLHGAIQISVEPGWDPKERKLPEGYFFDVAFLEVIDPYEPRPKAETKPKASQKPERGCTRLGGRMTVG